MGVLFFAETCDLHKHTYRSPYRPPIQLLYPPGEGARGSTAAPRHPSFHSGQRPRRRGGCWGGYGTRRAGSISPPSSPTPPFLRTSQRSGGPGRAALPGGVARSRARKGARKGARRGEANSRLRAANGEGGPRWHQISRSQSGGEGKE